MCIEIEILEKLTNRLPKYPTLKDLKINEWKEWNEYKVIGGSMKSQSIHNCNEVAICKTIMSKGTILEEHIHPGSAEILVVLEGTLKILMDNGVYTLSNSEYLKINENINHIAMAMENTTLLAVTIPKDDGFPG